MGLKTILEKTGAAGTTGANTIALPAAEGADARSLPLNQGLQPDAIYSVDFVRDSQDGRLAMFASMDGITFYQVAFRRLDTDVVVGGTLNLNASASFLVQLPHSRQNARIAAIRFSFWLGGAGGAGDTVVIKGREGRD